MYDLYIVKRTQIYIDEAQGERLARAAAGEDTTISALIRRAIDLYLDQGGQEAAHLERFQQAVADAAGSAPGLPAGEEYVDAVRPDYSERESALWGGRR